MKPQRIQLSRKKGWRMPPNTIKVDRTTRFGNPFVTGRHGRQIECVYWYLLLLSGYVNLSEGNFDAQTKASEVLRAEQKRGYPSLRGKNLACWCKLGAPCHGDLLLAVVNAPRRRRHATDVDEVLGRYGYHFEHGKGPVKNVAVQP